jgi:hypothetical protein
MVEAVLLPELAAAAERALDLPRREVLPRIALAEHRLLVRKRGEDVDVVRHNDEVGQLVTVIVESQHTVSDDGREFGAAEDAFAVATIEILVPPVGEVSLKLGDKLGGELLQFVAPM